MSIIAEFPRKNTYKLVCKCFIIFKLTCIYKDTGGRGRNNLIVIEFIGVSNAGV
jgi:hypothetical protein